MQKIRFKLIICNDSIKILRQKREADWSAIRPGCNERESAKKTLLTRTPCLINIFSHRSDAHCKRGRSRSSPLRVLNITFSEFTKNLYTNPCQIG
ncbi:MAG TPA: hypothetical protein VGP58_03785 [Pyrinomonadaceae bacterium]|nr:hypothetical protein [Pyrinomonadaceae bacterium]